MKPKFNNKVCVVTGAASGIGRELAICLAEQGAKLAISDVNIEGLAETAEMLKALNANVHSRFLDVADSASIYAYPDQVLAAFGRIDQLYNNAGISGGGRSIAETSDAVIDRVMNINLNGVLHMSRAFLPHLTAHPGSVLVNMSSLNGFLAQPNIAIYCLTKFAVRGLTEAMRADAMMNGQDTQIVVVHPGGVKTNIANQRRNEMSDEPPEVRRQAEAMVKIYQEKFLTYPARDAALDILRGVAKGKSRIIITPKAKQLDLLVRFLPSSYIPQVVQSLKKIRKSIKRSA
ncbi:MAG: acetoin dehydrogenase [Ponticaulis sp.]|nr:acetoin dehydrogenase [Ponticaulis sp.]|tara:strand:- start:5102 stop:5968 length:867 start_codon:yes stop_codon:yes gene_type:complete